MNDFAFVSNNGVCEGFQPGMGESNTLATEILDENGSVNGISLEFIGEGKECLVVNLQCDKEGGELTQIFDSAASGGCNYEVSFTSEKGCPVFSDGRLSMFLQKYESLWGAVIILVGIFLGFFGNKFEKAMLFTVGTIASFFVSVELEFKLLEATDRNPS